MTIKRLLLLLLLVGLAGTGHGATTEIPLSGIYRGDQPISVSSDRLEADELAHRVLFVGHVAVRQGDFTLYADEVKISYQEGQREIEKVEATGEVRIVQGNRVATGDRAVLFNKEGRIVLTGAAKVHQGQDFIQGDEITVFLNEDKSIVSSQEGGRVNAVFHPQKEQP